MMMTRIAVLVSAILLVGCASQASAESIFNDGFQDGDANGWGAGGDGSVSLTTYAGNVSMRLDKQAAAFAAVTTEGYSNVRVSGSFAASDLEGRDTCIFEVSADDGANWTSIVEVRDGQDDQVTLHSNAVTSAAFDNQPRLILRARAAGNSDNDVCWFDNASVTGMWIVDAFNRPTRFNADDLLGGGVMDRPVSTSAFAPPSDAGEALSPFQGRLSFRGGQARGGFTIHRDRFEFDEMPDTELTQLPDFSFEFVSHDGRLLPAERGFITSDHPFWEYVLAPGRVWHEEGYGDWSRAALPFAVLEKNANCTHNGLLTFLYNADGDVSDVAYQLGSETCAYFQFDAWGLVEVSYQPGELSSAQALIDADTEELANRLRVQPLSALAMAYPSVDLTAFASEQDIDPAALTTFGLVYDGTHYVGGCETRFGPYPFCDELIIPSYSFAKSIFGGFALMRLEQLYPGSSQALISDHVPACATNDDWREITFEHALDMATGHYSSIVPDADENVAVQADFFVVETHAEKVELACRKYPRREAPGQTFVYHTTDTYLLGTGIADYLKSQMGPEADVYEDLIAKAIWEPLGLSSTIKSTRRTYDQIGQPFAGWGLVMQRGDLARVLDFLSDGSGAIDGEQVLDPRLLRSALQRDSADRGLSTGSDAFRYNNGFWAWNIAEYGGCGTDTWIPFMSGFGGLSASILPNGAAYYYISDDYDFVWGRAAMATTEIGPVCGSAE
ncbi:MAG: serine hydrolase [Pseudomonadota bacterium]